MSKERNAAEDIQQRALGAMLTDAFFTWPSAVNIAFTIVMVFLLPHFIFPLFWQPWFWIVIGAVLEAIYLGLTLTDPVASQQAVSRMLVERFNPAQIHNIGARQQMQYALEYKKSIDAFVNQQTGARKVSLSETANNINTWIENIYELARRIDNFDSNKLLNEDRRNAPTELQDLKRRLAIETDASVKDELRHAVEIRQQQLEYLQSAESEVKRDVIKIENTVAQLRTVYAQMQVLDSKLMDGSRAQRIDEAIQEEIASLSDTIKAIDEVQSYKGYKSAVQDLKAQDVSSDIMSSTDDSVRSQTRSSGKP